MKHGLHGELGMVTGAAGCIGRVICATFAREGAAIGVLDVDSDRAVMTAAGLVASGARAIAVGVDVSDAEQVAHALEVVTTQLGPVDVLANAHGVSPSRRLLQADQDEWDRTFVVNTGGTMLAR